MDSNYQTILQCIGLHKTFPPSSPDSPSLHIVKGVDLDVSPGEIVGIVGASGAGKSTLLHLLGGLDRATMGRVVWQGKDISTIGDDALAKLRTTFVGFVFQFHHLLPEFTALENVALASMISGKSKTHSEQEARAILSSVGINERVNHMPAELSGGEQQRVAIARALVNRPAVVLADEPTGNLDTANADQFYELILELNRGGQTFVVVTHNERLSQRFPRVFQMVDGILRMSPEQS